MRSGKRLQDVRHDSNATFQFVKSNVSPTHHCSISREYNTILERLVYSSKGRNDSRLSNHQSQLSGISTQQRSIAKPALGVISKALPPQNDVTLNRNAENLIFNPATKAYETCSPLSIVNLFPRLNVSNVSNLISKPKNGGLASESSDIALKIYPQNEAANTSEHFFVNFLHLKFKIDHKVSGKSIASLDLLPKIRYRIGGKRECVHQLVKSFDQNGDSIVDLYLLLRFRGVYWIDILVREREELYAESVSLSQLFQTRSEGVRIIPKRVIQGAWRSTYSYWIYNNYPSFRHDIRPNPSLFQYTRLGDDSDYQVLSPLQNILPRGIAILFRVRLDTTRFKKPCVYMDPQDYYPRRVIRLLREKKGSFFLTQAPQQKHAKKSKKGSSTQNPSEPDYQFFEASILLDLFSSTSRKPPFVNIFVFRQDDTFLSKPIVISRYEVCESYPVIGADFHEENLPPLCTSTLPPPSTFAKVLSSQYEIETKSYIQTVPEKYGKSTFLVYGPQSTSLAGDHKGHTTKNWNASRKPGKPTSLSLKARERRDEKDGKLKNSYFLLPKIAGEGNQIMMQTLPTKLVQNQQKREKQGRIKLQTRQLRKMQEIFDNWDYNDLAPPSQPTHEKEKIVERSRLLLDLEKVNQSSSDSVNRPTLEEWSTPVSSDDSSSVFEYNKVNFHREVFSSDTLSSIPTLSSGYLDMLSEENEGYLSGDGISPETIYEHLTPGMIPIDLNQFDALSETLYTEEYSTSDFESTSMQSMGKPFNSALNLQSSEDTTSDLIYQPKELAQQDMADESEAMLSKEIFFARCIRIRYGQRVVSFEYIPKVIPLSSHDIRHTLGLTAQQLLFLKIIALYDPENNKTYKFIPSSSSSSSILEKQYLDENVIYDVVVEDTREADIEQLTQEEKDAIFARFRAIDRDGNGQVDLEEATHYYTQEEERKLHVHLDMLDKLLKNDPLRKEEIEERKQKAIMLCKQLIEQHIISFSDADIDRSGTIDQFEFLKHEGRIALARR